MSREAFPELPPSSQAHMEDFPTELRTETQNRLLALSHKALHTENDFGTAPIPRMELGEEHQPHIDSVAKHMEIASRLLGFARGELDTDEVADREISFDLLAGKAKELAIISAKEEKQAGNIEAAVEALESLLVIESLESTGSTGQTRRRQAEEITRTIVAEGLATEFVEATHKTFGLVALDDRDAVPLNAIAESCPKLLRAATKLEFSDDFSDVEYSEKRGDTTGLSCGDLLALAKLAETEHSYEDTHQELLKQALATAAVEHVEPEDLVEVLAQAVKSPLNLEVRDALSALRLRRKAGDSTFRQNDENTALLDDAVVILMRRGEMDLAKELVSSSPNDIDHLRQAVEHEPVDTAEKTRLITTLDQLCQHKQSELRRHLQASGASELTSVWVIQTAKDPDSAADIPTEFWRMLEQNHSIRDLLMSTSDLARSAEALIAIDNSGLAEYSDLLLAKVLGLGESEGASSYLASVSEALGILGQQQESQGGRDINLRKILKDLADFADPAMALEAAKTFYGSDTYLQELRSIYALVHPDRDTELATFRPEDISALIALRDYCATAGLGTSYIEAVSTVLLRGIDPVTRAQRIVEGLRLANITADTNPALFFDIARREDPISLGRAVSLAEHQLADSSDAIRQDVLRIIIGDESPEDLVLLLGRAQRELQNHKLSIDDIGTDKLFEMMSLIGGNEDDKTIEKFCINWKIQHEGEEAYKKYWHAALESGDVRAISVEQKPKLADLPELRARFEHLGIASGLAESMVESWLTFSALRRRLYRDGRMETKASAVDVNAGATEQGYHIVKQLDALTTYMEQFGIEETVALTSTFGIYNFIRYNSGQLHDQLLSWQSGEPPAKNILVSARSDWNGAVSDAGKSFETTLGSEGLFCFEVNDEVELAKVAVATGIREREMGRKPEEDNVLENFIIDGHANPDGILLGTDRQALSTADYTREPLNGQRANNYRRHLGSKFRVILKACSTAAEVAYGKNIAETISDHHDVRVEGSKTITKGSVVIEPDGTVRFNDGEVLSTSYA